jgi:hypothetical protein
MLKGIKCDARKHNHWLTPIINWQESALKVRHSSNQIKCDLLFRVEHQVVESHHTGSLGTKDSYFL